MSFTKRRLFDTLKRLKKGVFFSMIEWIVSFVSAVCAAFVYLKTWHKQISPLFTVSRLFGTIHQSVNREGRKIIRAHRAKYAEKSLDTKLNGMGRLFLRQMSELLPLLEASRTYRAHTHVKLLFEKTHRDGKITICKMRKTRKRWLLTEAVVLLGFRDTFRILLSKEYRCRLYKQFYKITFTKK